MVKGNTETLTMRIVRSKLIKRDESHIDSSRERNKNENDYNSINDYSEPDAIIKENQHVPFVRTSGVNAEMITRDNVTDISEWTFPPKAPVPHIYHMNPEMLVTNEKIGFKGFRKQFSGRFKRLVARKLEPVPVIPPELKSQLKTIYVY